MEQEGIVHALEEIYRLLGPGGILIDIHPTMAPTLIEVHHGGTITFSAPVPDQSFQYIQYADEAIAVVIKDGLFTIEEDIEFEWRTYASSVDELRDYIIQESGYVEEPGEEVIALQNAKFIERVQGAMLAAGKGSEVARLYTARIARLDTVD
jgi:hypothetical protein